MPENQGIAGGQYRTGLQQSVALHVRFGCRMDGVYASVVAALSQRLQFDRVNGWNRDVCVLDSNGIACYVGSIHHAVFPLSLSVAATALRTHPNTFPLALVPFRSFHETSAASPHITAASAGSYILSSWKSK